jgi:hypothetical protein
MLRLASAGVGDLQLSHTDFEKVITSKMNFRKIFSAMILQGKHHFSLTTLTARIE